MTKRTFNKLCRLLFGKRKNGEAEPNEQERHDMLLYVVRNRGAIHPKLVTPLLDWAWLRSMGYLHRSEQGFLCTCENKR